MAAQHSALSDVNYDASTADLDYVIGRSFPDCLQYFARRTLIDPDEFESHWRQDFDARIRIELTVYPDATECAQALKDRGIPIAIATQTPRTSFKHPAQYHQAGRPYPGNRLPNRRRPTQARARPLPRGIPQAAQRESPRLHRCRGQPRRNKIGPRRRTAGPRHRTTPGRPPGHQRRPGGLGRSQFKLGLLSSRLRTE